MKLWFSQKGYPQILIESETSIVKISGQRVFHTTKVDKGVPLVVTYHCLLKSIGKMTYDNLYLLYMKTFFFEWAKILFFDSLHRFACDF